MIIKAKLDTDIRRLTINDVEFRQLSFTRFREILAVPFDLTAKTFVIKYKDEEGDFISITSDVEFAEAKRFTEAIDPTIFRVQLFVKAVEAPCPIQEFVNVVVPIIKRGKVRRFIHKAIKTFINNQTKVPQEQHVESACSSETKPIQIDKNIEIKPIATVNVPPLVQEIPIKVQQKVENSQNVTNIKQLPITMSNVPIQNPPIIQSSTPTETTKKPMLYCQFIRDVTISDGIIILPNKEFVKTWRMRNSSTVPLENCTLKFINGVNLIKDVDSVLVRGPIAVNEEFDISITLISPTTKGRYVSYWQMTNPSGEKFGHQIWVDIEVKDSEYNTLPQIITPNNNNSNKQSQDAKREIKIYDNPKFAEWAGLLARLAEMGFNDVDSNITILTSTKGNLEQALQILLDQGNR